MSYVSASQIDLAIDCWRKFAFAYILNLKISKPYQIIGQLIHSGIEDYLLHDILPDTEEVFRPSPESRLYPLGKLILNGIVHLPARNTLVEILGIEREIDFIIGNIRYVGFIDLLWAHANHEYIHIWDHKTSTDPNRWSKTPKQLKLDTQAIIYAYAVFKWYKWLEEIEFTHHYIDTQNKGRDKLVSCFLSRDYVQQQFYNRIQPIAKKIEYYKSCNINPNKLKPNTKTCDKYGGCPYRSKCKLSLAQRFRDQH